MSSRFIVVSTGILLTSLILSTSRPAHAQWTEVSGYTIVSTSLTSSGPGDYGGSYVADDQFEVWATEAPTTNSLISSSHQILRVFRKDYTWQGPTPNTGSFVVNGGGFLSGVAEITPSSWYAAASAEGEVTFPLSGGVSSSSDSCAAYYNNTPKSFSKTPSGNINVSVGSSTATTVSFNYSIRAKASGSIGQGASSGTATYEGRSSPHCAVWGIVP